MEFRKPYENDNEIQKYKHNSLLIFAMMLRFDEIDPHKIASECLTDNADDKKIDFIRYDSEAGHITLAQGYQSSNWEKKAAPANKASDLNTAVSWLISGDLHLISKKNANLRATALEIRDALKNGDVNSLELLYVHNLKSSANVQKELQTCAANAKKLLENYNISDPEVTFLEVDAERINQWYLSRENSIVVSDEIEIPIKNGFIRENGDGWEAIVCSTEIKHVHALYSKYEDQLFSANVRGFLGVRKSARNINQNIRLTAEKYPGNFWVFNNGITAITRNITPNDDKIILSGISIINGAQTTGSIHKAALEKIMGAKVMLRLIVTNNPELIKEIVRYNNTQNVVYTWELRSGDRFQKRLRTEFSKIGIKYLNRRSYKRAVGDVVPVPAASQSMMAFHGKPLVALKGKTVIFDSDTNYSLIFNDHTTARHICFVYSIVKAYDSYKNTLRTKSPESQTTNDKKNLEYMSHISFKQFLVYCIGFSIEEIIERSVPNKLQIGFDDSIRNLSEMEDLWMPIVTTMVNGITSSEPSLDNLHVSMKSDERMQKVAESVRSFISAIRTNAPKNFDVFSQKVVIGQLH